MKIIQIIKDSLIFANFFKTKSFLLEQNNKKGM